MTKPLFFSFVALLLWAALPRFAAPAPAEAESPDFNAFIAAFPKAALPYRIDAATERRELDRAYEDEREPSLRYQEISGNHLDLLPYRAPRFSRMGPNAQYFVAHLAETERFHAVIVGSSPPFSYLVEDYYIITYDKGGKRLHHQKIEGYGAHRSIEALGVDSQLRIVVSYEADIEDGSDEGYHSERRYDYFRILPSGHIQTQHKNLDKPREQSTAS